MLFGRGRLLLGLALCGCAAWPAVFSPTATPAAGTRVVTVHLADRGKGTWSTAGARLVLTYAWRGTLRFAVPAGARFSARSSTTLRAGWRGALSGPVQCRYARTNVPGRITAVLTNGTTRGTLRVVLHARSRRGFFPATKASAPCSSPAHFEPAWLFRDNLEDHGRLTADTAVIAVPRTLLAHGSTTITFPHEVGTVDRPLRPKVTWNNRGRLRLQVD